MSAEKIVGIKKIGLMPTMDIEVKSDRHLFYGNGIATSNSHSIAYGIMGYWSAYAKAHFPNEFFKCWLADSIEQADGEDDVKLLTADAVNFDVEVKTPTVVDKQPNFYTDGETLRFGLLNIKGVGESVFVKFGKIVDEAENLLQKPLSNFSWLEFLLYVSQGINSKAMVAMILSGSLDHFKLPRLRMKFEYEKYSELTDKELEWARNNFQSMNPTHLLDMFRKMCKLKGEGGALHDKRRLSTMKDLIRTLENPPYELKDNPNKIIENEKRLLGVALSYNIGDCMDNGAVNISCREFLEGRSIKEMIFGVEIAGVRPHVIKKKTSKYFGEKMYFLDITDGTANITNCTVFPNQFQEFGELLSKGNRVLIFGKRDENYNSLTINKVQQA